MAFTRIKWLMTIVICALTGHNCMASGGEYDEVPIALDYYMTRVPAKSVSQIYSEFGAAIPAGKPVEIPPEELIRDFAGGASPKLVQKVDDLLSRSRSPYAGATQINLLQDLRDLAQNSQATGAEMGTYVKWRLDHLALFQKPEFYAYQKPAVPKNGFARIETEAAKASKAMAAHWLFLEGAFYYKNGDDTTSEGYFDQVLTAYPNSPRAEAALFMKARCKLSQSVPADDDGMNADAGKKKEAQTLFQSYLSKYPRGRYVSDVTGWLGGVAYRSTDPAAALGYYTQQLGMKDHPENFGSALVMIEKILAREKPDNDATLDAVAEHPPVALALAYFVLNFTQPRDGDSDQDYQAYATWRHGVLPRLGQAVLRHKNLYEGAAWQDRYLAILAHAASDQGDQKQALDLVMMGGKSDAPKDDLLFAKALVLQRSKQFADAEKAYRELLEKFPQSPLARGARYRLALALHDQARDGDALLELAALRENHLTLRPYPSPSAALQQAQAEVSDTTSALGIDYTGAPDQQIAETIDTILNFAPMPELEKAYKASSDPGRAELHSDLGQVLQERYLDHDDFRQAARFSDVPQIQQQWNQLAQKSEELTNASGKVKAKGCMDLADFWVANRKMLPAMPLDSLDARNSLSFDANADTYRASNAALLSYTKPENELESREGLWHAVKWWGLASQTHDAEVAPTALWSVIKARRTIAEVNPYTWKRALDGQAGPDSKADYDLITSKYPTSPEAQHEAVYWTFTKDYHQLSYNRYSVGLDRDDLSPDWLNALGLSPADDNAYRGEDDATVQELRKMISRAATEDSKTFAQDTQGFRNSVGSPTSLDDADTLNCADDLVMFGQVDGVAPEVRSMYVKARYQLAYGGPVGAYRDDNGQIVQSVDLDALRKQPTGDKVQDFIDFLDLARTAHSEIDVPVKDLDKDGQPLTFLSRDYQGLLSKSTAFLGKYPKSVKREAARLLQIRALVRLSRPREVPWSIDWPAANRWDDEYAPRFLTLAPFDAGATASAFKAYEDEFPHGQYSSSILGLRADVDLIQKHWGDALDHLMALLSQQTAPELHNGAASELTYVFDQLDKDERREEVMAEIMKRPDVRKNLSLYISSGGLAPLKDYLLAELNVPQK